MMCMWLGFRLWRLGIELVPALMSALKDAGASNITVVCGGVPEQFQQAPDDVPWLLEQGFTSGTRIPVAAIEVLGAIG